MLRIGLISDTHDLLRAEALAAMRGVDRILHAGDICGDTVLEALGTIAPVAAVRGNNDRGTWAERLPADATVELDGVRIHIVHDIATMALDPRAAGIGVVISGHSHRPSIAMRDGVLHVNPGSAGPRRFSLPIAMAELTIQGGAVAARIIALGPRPNAA